MDNTSFAPGNNSINNSVPPPSPQYSASNPKHLSKLVTLVVLSLTLGLAAYAGILYWQDQKLGEEYAISFTPRPSVTADPIADWKTYTNTQYGFEVKYPAFLYNKTDPNVFFNFESTPLKLFLGGVSPENAGVEGKDYIINDGYRIFATTEEKKNIVIDLTKSIPDSYKSTKINIPGIEAYRIDDLGGVTCGPDVYINTSVISNKYIRLGYCAYTNYPIDNLFDQILSTFKFTQ